MSRLIDFYRFQTLIFFWQLKLVNELLPPSPRPTLPRQPVFTLAPAGQCTPPEVIPFGNEVIRTFNGASATVGDRIEYSCLM